MTPLLVEWCGRSLLVAAAMAAVLKISRVREPVMLFRAWSIVTLVMLVTPLIVLWRPGFLAFPVPAASNVTPAVVSVLFEVSEIELSPVSIAPAGPQVAVVNHDLDWIALVWVSGVLVSLLRLAIGTITSARLVRSARQDGRGLLVHDGCASPVTAGFWRPVVILPSSAAEWCPAKLRAVLQHERAHVRRRDPLVFWVADFNRCIYWFFPLASWLSRKLRGLAEEVCDAEVLGDGHEAAQYAQWLLEIGATVTAAGSRLGIRGANATTGLSRRIERILRGEAVATGEGMWHSRLAVACGMTIAVLCAACRPQTQQTLPGQPSMNELLHRRASERRDAMRKTETLEETARGLTEEKAQLLAVELKKRPGDVDLAHALLRYYQMRSDVGGITRIALWQIEHHPNGSVTPWLIHPAWGLPAWEKGAVLWRRNLTKPDATAETYRRAAAYLEGGLREEAERILLQGQERFPGRHWTATLGQLYASILIGARGPRTEFNTFAATSPEGWNGPVTQRVRRQLLASQDAPLLIQTAQWVLSWTTRDGGNEPPSLGFASSLIDRALEVEPGNEAAQFLHFRAGAVRDSLRLRGIPFEKLSAEDRMRHLTRRLLAPSRDHGGATEDESARQLLALAADHRHSTEYGLALYAARSAQARVALRRGDRKTAAELMLSSIERPDHVALRFGPLDMTTARELVDWGERNAVATFLERCARFNRRGKELAHWAEEIRRGRNPDLLPYSS